MTLPPVPPNLDFRLSAFLEALRKAILDTNKKFGDTGITVDEDGNTVIPGAFEIVYETPVALAGTGETEDTEDAWTTVASGAPAGTSYAVIQFYMVSGSDDAAGQLSWRTSSGEAEIVAAIIKGDGTSDNDRASIAAYIVPLNSGDLDYKADTTAGTVTWSVRRIGYIV